MFLVRPREKLFLDYKKNVGRIVASCHIFVPTKVAIMYDKLSRIKSSGSFRRNVAKNYLKIVQTHPIRVVETLRAVNQPFQNAVEPTTTPRTIARQSD